MSCLDKRTYAETFGAVMDGSTDDTIAVESAAQSAIAGNGILTIAGDCRFDPSFMAALSASAGLTIEVTERLRPLTTIPIVGSKKIIGLGNGGIQFQKSLAAEIVAPEDGGRVIHAYGTDVLLENLFINGCNNGILLGGNSNINALFKLKNVGVLSTASGGIALDIDNLFWFWSEGCVFSTTSVGEYSIRVDNSLRVGGSVGLVYFQNLITSGKGTRLVAPVSVGSGEMQNIHFDDWHHENLPNGGVVLDARNVASVYVDGYGNSDPLGADYHDFDLDGCKYFSLRNAIPCRFKSLPVGGSFNVDDTHRYMNTTIEIGSSKPEMASTFRGSTNARLMSRAHSAVASPGLGTAIKVSVPTGVFGGIDFTSGHYAPDGSQTAYMLEATGAPTPAQRLSYNILQTGYSLSAGDYLVLFGMVKAKDTTSGINSDKGCLNISFRNAPVALLTGSGRTSFEAAPIGLEHAQKDDGWMPATSALRVLEGKTSDVAVSVIMRGASSGWYLWKPVVRIIPASYGFSDIDILRLMQAHGSAHDAPAGVVSLHDHQPFRTGSVASSSRPLASFVGSGVQIWDETLKKPIWSDGTDWIDAMGNVV